MPPGKLAYDRPSMKFVSFLRKHYDLVSFTPQANNFVVFKCYFDDVGFGILVSFYLFGFFVIIIFLFIFILLFF